MKLIKNWEELAKVPSSNTHYLEITPENGNGWVRPSSPKVGEFLDGRHYLSTHTFYGETHKRSTELLQRCGFDIVLANWDEEK